jgi:hypothetical protein
LVVSAITYPQRREQQFASRLILAICFWVAPTGKSSLFEKRDFRYCKQNTREWTNNNISFIRNSSF